LLAELGPDAHQVHLRLGDRRRAMALVSREPGVAPLGDGGACLTWFDVRPAYELGGLLVQPALRICSAGEVPCMFSIGVIPVARAVHAVGSLLD
jgi:hypothetical protein